jgi:formylglycine-generating enzyme required for sulfatase activity
VSNALFRRFRADHDSGRYEGESLNGDAQPVVNVSWEDAIAFCRWLGEREGDPDLYRLPTEAEWEYACRAGTSACYFWGEAQAEARRYANACDADAKQRLGFGFDCFPRPDGHIVSAPIGSFAANPWGLYDMTGNVWELTSSWYGPYPDAAATDPTGPAAGTSRVMRGGSWSVPPQASRVAYRGSQAPDKGTDFIGFRLVAVRAPRRR